MMTAMMTYTRAMLMLPRIMLSVAGTATRVCAVLDACEELETRAAAAADSATDQQTEGSIVLDSVTVQSP